jgi:hypothetical protein
VSAAVQTPGTVGAILAEVSSDCDATLDTLIKVEEAIPYSTVVLARADLVLTARINAMLPADADQDDLYRRRDSLGVQFSALGRPAEAPGVRSGRRHPKAGTAAAVVHEHFLPARAGVWNWTPPPAGSSSARPDSDR